MRRAFLAFVVGAMAWRTFGTKMATSYVAAHDGEEAEPDPEENTCQDDKEFQEQK